MVDSPCLYSSSIDLEDLRRCWPDSREILVQAPADWAAKPAFEKAPPVYKVEIALDLQRFPHSRRWKPSWMRKLLG